MKYIFSLFLFCLPSIVSAKIYKGAEYRTIESYTYGRFEVRMKSSQREGMLSSFFTYHENTGTDNWNEIDIEILGRYSDDVQFNPITPGQTNHVSHYKTSFNPAFDFHTYAFEWTPTYVAWFVDGIEVHRATGTDIEKLNLPQKIMMNIWNPEYPDWAGEWNEKILPAFAYYDWVSYSSYTPDSGSVGTDNNFTLQWKDDFDSWDQNRWQKATHTWGGNGSDFVQENAVIKDGMLILCLTKETALGYTDNTPPAVLAARAEKDGIKVMFSEEVDSSSAVSTTNYIVVGKTVTGAVLYSDLKTVKLTIADYDTAAVANIVVKNVKDRWITPNAMTPVNVVLIKTIPVTFPLRINCGGPAYKTYLADQKWNDAAEYGYVDGTAYTNSKTILGTTDLEVYNSEVNGSVEYLIRVPNGQYTVILMMAENYFIQSTQRIFSVAVQDSVIISNLDLYASIGASTSYQKNIVNVTVSEDILDIHFMAALNTAIINGIQVFAMPTGINDNGSTAPGEWKVGQNYPNPFNGMTVIPFSIPSDENISIKFFDSLGREINSHSMGILRSGNHQYKWDATDRHGMALASGVYYYTIQGLNHSSTRKLILLR